MSTGWQENTQRVYTHGNEAAGRHTNTCQTPMDWMAGVTAARWSEVSAGSDSSRALTRLFVEHAIQVGGCLRFKDGDWRFTDEQQSASPRSMRLLSVRRAIRSASARAASGGWAQPDLPTTESGCLTGTRSSMACSRLASMGRWALAWSNEVVVGAGEKTDGRSDHHRTQEGERRGCRWTICRLGCRW